MKKFVKNNLKVIVAVFITAIVVGGIGVYATEELLESRKVSYNDTRVDGALNELYQKAAGINLEGRQVCKLICEEYGSYLSVGSKYECEVATGVKKNFYLLAETPTSVKLIMDRNITQGTNTTTMSWNNAMKYIDSNNLKTTWTNVVDIDLPEVQDIVNAVGNSSWKAADSGATWWCLASGNQDYPSSAPWCDAESSSAYNWLYDYTIGCNGCTHSLSSPEAYGYWTRSLIASSSRAWRVAADGFLDYDTFSGSNNNGVRPVITVNRSNIYKVNN